MVPGRASLQLALAQVVVRVYSSGGDSGGGGFWDVPPPDGPTTGQKVQVLWDVPAVWSSGEVAGFDAASGAHFVRYDSGFNARVHLAPHRWSLSLNKSDPAPRPELESGRAREEASSLEGARIRVFSERFSMWHNGTVGQCDVHLGEIGKCAVDFVEGPRNGTSAMYNFSTAAGLRWRGEFMPEPERWALPRLARFHGAPNFMELDVDAALVARARRWYERHVLPQMRSRTRDSWVTSAEGDEEEEAPAGERGATAREYSWFSRFAGERFGSDIKWVSPADVATHERMSAFYHQSGVGRHLEPFLDLTPGNTARRLRVYIPSFVVRSRVRKSFHHHDWLPAGGSNGLTLMVPLYDMANATEGCNLLYKDEALKEHVYKYTLGKGAVFGGGTWHASQPCRPRSQLERERPWAFLCFNFGTDKAEYWPTLHENIACSGKLIVQPDGEVAPEASCNSYNDALKQGEQMLRDEAQKEVLEALTEHAVGQLEVDQLKESLARIGVSLPAALSLKPDIASFLNENVRVLLEELAARQREEAAAAKAAAAAEEEEAEEEKVRSDAKVIGGGNRTEVCGPEEVCTGVPHDVCSSGYGQCTGGGTCQNDCEGEGGALQCCTLAPTPGPTPETVKRALPPAPTPLSPEELATAQREEATAATPMVREDEERTELKGAGSCDSRDCAVETTHSVAMRRALLESEEVEEKRQ